ncbi:hypothetical protein HK405_004067 [Cladochytrium tenue]|nr:hypothetical protein HK405_004067 [Cladochytrium tenue]
MAKKRPSRRTEPSAASAPGAAVASRTGTTSGALVPPPRKRARGGGGGSGGGGDPRFSLSKLGVSAALAAARLAHQPDDDDDDDDDDDVEGDDVDEKFVAGSADYAVPIDEEGDSEVGGAGAIGHASDDSQDDQSGGGDDDDDNDDDDQDDSRYEHELGDDQDPAADSVDKEETDSGDVHSVNVGADGDDDGAKPGVAVAGPLDAILRRRGHQPRAGAGEAQEGDGAATAQTEQKKKKLKEEEEDKRGVLYIGRLPPFMEVSKLRQLLGAHAGGAHNLLRVYMAAEDSPASSSSRGGGSKRRRGGSASAAAAAATSAGGGRRRVNYTEAWVEVRQRRTARHMAAALHGQPMEARGRFRDDLWSVRYLRGFSWRDLAAHVEVERRAREARLRVEMAGVRRTNEEYRRSVARAKMLDAIEEKRNRKAAAAAGAAVATGPAGESVAAAGSGFSRHTREFRQRVVHGKAAGGGPAPQSMPAGPSRVAMLAKIFGTSS